MATVSHPIFARVYQRLSVTMDRAGGAEHRRHLVAGLHGRVIEVGAGNGRTFAHYPGTVTEVVAVEPEPRLRAAALVAAAQPGAMRRVQRIADATLWPKLFAGCHTGRDTPAAIAAAGFDVEELHRFKFPATGPSGPAAPHIRGTANRPSEESTP